jgi:hypothetical protein
MGPFHLVEEERMGIEWWLSARWSRYLACGLILGFLAVPALAPQPAPATPPEMSEFSPIKCPLCKHLDALIYNADSGCQFGPGGCHWEM